MLFRGRNNIAVGAAIFEAKKNKIYFLAKMNAIVLYYLLIMNVTSFVMFGMDKWKAKWGCWRIKEVQLWFIGLLGGWLGGIIGMWTFNHKLQKASFMIPYIGLSAANLIILWKFNLL
jgi:uncharacterized membrane protein YsdA (DUF1294 family)